MGELLAGLHGIVLLPMCILAAWVLAEWRRRRRLEAFGDPCLLGISRRWPPRILAAALFAAALTATGVIVTAPPGVPEEADESANACALLIDGQAVAGSPGASGSARERLERAVEVVVGEGEGLRFSVHVAAGELRPVVPETFDRQGILLMMQGFLPEGGRAAPGTLRRCLEELCARERAPASRLKVVVISGRATEDLAGELQAPGACPVLLFRPESSAEPPEFAAIGAEGVRHWGGDPGILRRFLADRESAPPAAGPSSAVPRLAGLALILAAAERILTILAPLYAQR